MIEPIPPPICIKQNFTFTFLCTFDTSTGLQLLLQKQLSSKSQAVNEFVFRTDS